MTDELTALSDCVARRCAAAAPLLLTVAPGTRAQRSGFFWQEGIAVTAEQDLPKHGELPVVLAGGARQMARLAGRDQGTNVAVLRLEGGTASPPPVAAVQAGTLALALGALDGRPTARLGVVHHVGPAWDSLAGGRIEQDIRLDVALTPRDEGGPVLATDGSLIGMSTLGPRGRSIVIPAATLARAVPLLLEAGRGDGWIGVGLQPVGLPSALRERAGREAGLMVVGLAAGGPAEQAGVLPGDILLDVGGEATRHPRAVARALSLIPVGRNVALRLLRAGAPMDVHATVAMRPAA